MKFYKRSKQWRNSSQSLIFYADEMRATSYNWYCLFKVMHGKNVLNVYSYSRSTDRHVWQMKSLLSELNIPIDLEIEAPMGLDKIVDCISYYENKIKTLKLKNEHPNSRGRAKKWRLMDIDRLESQYEIFTQILFDAQFLNDFEQSQAG